MSARLPVHFSSPGHKWAVATVCPSTTTCDWGLIILLQAPRKPVLQEQFQFRKITTKTTTMDDGERGKTLSGTCIVGAEMGTNDGLEGVNKHMT